MSPFNFSGSGVGYGPFDAKNTSHNYGSHLHSSSALANLPITLKQFAQQHNMPESSVKSLARRAKIAVLRLGAEEFIDGLALEKSFQELYSLTQQKYIFRQGVERSYRAIEKARVQMFENQCLESGQEITRASTRKEISTIMCEQDKIMAGESTVSLDRAQTLHNLLRNQHVDVTPSNTREETHTTGGLLRGIPNRIPEYTATERGLIREGPKRFPERKGASTGTLLREDPKRFSEFTALNTPTIRRVAPTPTLLDLSTKGTDKGLIPSPWDSSASPRPAVRPTGAPVILHPTPELVEAVKERNVETVNKLLTDRGLPALAKPASFC